jgi:autotransporter-associated beta strand protein
VTATLGSVTISAAGQNYGYYQDAYSGSVSAKADVNINGYATAGDGIYVNIGSISSSHGNVILSGTTTSTNTAHYGIESTKSVSAANGSVTFQASKLDTVTTLANAIISRTINSRPDPYFAIADSSNMASAASVGLNWTGAVTANSSTGYISINAKAPSITGAMTAYGVNLLADNQSYILNSTSNSINTLAADIGTGSLTFVNSGVLNIGSYNGVTGITATGLTLTAGGLTDTNDAGITTTSSSTITINNASGSYDYSGVIAGPVALTKSGNGSQTLSAENSYTGLTTISAGTLKLGVAGGSTNTPLGTTAAGTTISAGGTLDLNGYSLGTAEALTINGYGIGNIGALINSSAANAATYSGAITVGSTSYIGGSGSMILTGAVSAASYGVAFIGTGSYTATNASNTFSTISTSGIGSLSIKNNRDLSIGAIVNAISGMTFTGDVLFDNTGSITLPGYVIQKNGSSNSTITFKSSARVNAWYSSNQIKTDTAGGTGKLNIIFWAESDGGNGAGTTLAGTYTTNGGHIWAGGGATSTTWNGLTVGAGAAGGGGSGFNGNAIDTQGTWTTGGGSIYLAANNSSTGYDILLGNGAAQVFNVGAGSISLIGDYQASSSTTTITSTGTLTISPFGNSFTNSSSVATAFTWSGTVATNYAGTGSINAITINAIANLGGLTIGNASSSSNSAVTISNAIGISGPINIYGAAVTLNANISTSNTTTGNIGITTTGLTGSGTISLAAGRNLSITQSGASTYSGAISGTSATVTKLGAGTLTLSGNSSYTGLTTISAGTIKLGGVGSGANSPLGTVAAGTVVESGAALDLGGYNLVTAEALTISGTGVSTSGALFNSSATASTYLGAVTLAADTTIRSTGDLTLSSTVDGAFALTVTNTGTVGFRSRVGSSGARLASISVSGPVNLSSDVWTTGAQTYSRNVGINDEISLNSSSGGVTIGGTVTGIQIPSTLLYETTSATRALDATSYSANNSGSFSGAITRITYRMEVKVGTTPYWVEVSFDPWASNLTASDLRIPDLSNNLVVQKIVQNMVVKSNQTSGISGKATAVNVGSGFTGYLELWPWNYGTEASAPIGVPTGDTTKYDFNDTHNSNGVYGSFQVHNITAGSTQTVLAWNNHTATTPDVGMGNYIGTTGNSNGNTDWTFTGGNATSLGKVDFKLQVRVNERNPGLTINGGSGAINITGAVSGLNALTVNSNATTSTITGAISDASGSATTLTKQGTGTLVLNGANSYTGATTVSAGTLKLGHATALGTAAAGTTITSGAVLDLNGQNISNEEALTISGTGISSGGALINSSSTAATFGGLLTLADDTLIVGETGTIALSNAGTITGSYDLTLGGAQGGSITSIIGTSTGSVTKVDAGTWTLAGLNTYTGGTDIDAGILKAGSARAFGASSGAVTVADGAVLDLNGIILTNTNALTLNGMGISTSGALTNSSATSGVYAGAITLGSTSAIGGTGGTVSVTGAVSDSANDYGLVFIGNKAISLSSTSNALRTIASGSSIGALTIVNAGDLEIGSITAGGTTYNGINASDAINVRTTGDLTISKNIATTSTSKSASAPALLLSAGSDEAAGSITKNILLVGSPTFTVGNGGAANFYTGGLTESADLKAYAEAQTNNNTATYYSTLTAQPTTAGYNVIYRGTPPYIYVTIVDGQSSTYGTASGLSFWYSTSASSYGSSYIPGLLSTLTTAQTFTAGASSMSVNVAGITGSISIDTALTSTLNADTYSLTLSPTLALTGVPGVSFRAGDAKSFVVNRKTVELSATKTYDSNTSLTNYVTVTTGVGSETLTYTGATSNNANVATANKYINAITLADGTNGGVATNYQLPTLDRANAPVTINAKTVTLSAEKTYDSNTSLTNYVTVTTGIGSQTLTYTGATANNANVATANKYINAITLANATDGSGGVATNYQLPTLDRANAPVTINAKTVTLSAEKTYDSNTSLTNYVTVTTGIGSQTLTYTGATANNANVATANKYINAITLADGTNGGVATNYQLPSLDRANAPVTINAKTVTLSAEKTYDSNTSLTNYVTVTTGVGSQTLTYTGATSNNANVASVNKYINAITLANATDGSGGVATNYQLPTLDRANAPVTINAKTVTLSAEKDI